jgi:hypothetical protein
MAKLRDMFKFGNAEYNKVDSFLAGIECEIESVDFLKDDANPYFHAETDGSLRNHGTEFISVPLAREDLIDKFKGLHASIVYHDKDEAFSPRTSTHVHINVRSLDEKQLHQMLLFYALFEDFFFAMVDPLRRDNIHCVPLSETILSNRYRSTATYLIKYWHKYTAFNLLPVAKQGTVEFRHLQGTDDADLLNRWLSTIENLWAICQEESMDKTSILDAENHKRWFNRIFKDAPEVLALAPAMPNKIQNNLIDVKLAFI